MLKISLFIILLLPLASMSEEIKILKEDKQHINEYMLRISQSSPSNFLCKLSTISKQLEENHEVAKLVVAKSALDAKAIYLALNMEGRVEDKVLPKSGGVTVKIPYHKANDINNLLFGQLENVYCLGFQEKSEGVNDLTAFSCSANTKSKVEGLNLSASLLAPSLESAQSIFMQTLEAREDGAGGVRIPYMNEGDTQVRWAELESANCNPILSNKEDSSSGSSIGSK